METETHPHLRFFKRSVIASTVAAALFAGGYAAHGGLPIGAAWCAPKDAAIASSPAASATPSTNGASPGSRALALPDFSQIVVQQGPAVVNISVAGSAKAAGAAGMPQLDPDDPFYEFFRRFQGPTPRGRVPVQGQGSGFIVSSDGIVLTNAHVVAEADEVTVKLTDKREFKAKVLGIDRPSDVAVLKIDAKNLPTVQIGSADNARVGEWVLAIGAPFGFENSVTAGILSAKSRSLPDEGYVPFLQTDAAINPGNSGGPLFNMNGEVIGINSQIYSRSGGYQGLSFAIPIDVAMKVQQQLVHHGKVSRGRIGVMIQDVNQDLADSFSLDKPAGALVSSVEKGSPADKAGLEAGDVILKFNGKSITRSGELPPLVSEQAPGSTATLDIWRKGKPQEIRLTLGEVASAAVAGKEGKNAGGGKLGLAVRPLNAEERRSADVSGGVLVLNVANGPAARAGIQPGDIILSVNGEKVTSAEQLQKAAEGRDKHLALQVQRGDNRLFVPLRLK
ncbi:MAG: DegQ family serine endoprotease [Sterolibacterium sp.]|nr:DegQ family serine endoprotease [Sterolibacterium sp.]MBP9799662.1 DegQ family serine endoprotease [Sterolibacterium sp.]